MKRYLEDIIQETLNQKMVFLGGARQVGKTTLGLSLLEGSDESHPAYLNWDDPLVPRQLKQKKLPSEQPLLVIDEIHKYRNWRNLIKGIYDTEKSRRQILVTGSARLDYYRRSGDSLANRYRYFRLHPLSLDEISQSPTKEDLKQLLNYGGFPEPFLEQSESFSRIWRRDRLSRVVRDDIQALEQIRHLDLIDQLIHMFPDRVGSPLSIKSLAEDIEVDHKTIKNWISILENIYVCFRISPFGSPKIRAVKKEQKLYLYDWTSIEDPGARFENLVASHLLKYCHFIEDTEGYDMELRYLRDTDKREVDFVVLKDKKPLFAIETKVSDKNLSPALKYFSERTVIPQFYQVHMGEQDYETENRRLIPFMKFVSKYSISKQLP